MKMAVRPFFFGNLRRRRLKFRSHGAAEDETGKRFYGIGGFVLFCKIRHHDIDAILEKQVKVHKKREYSRKYGR